MPDTQQIVETVHQLAGYPTAFLLAPLALATWGGARGHRGFGLAFVSLMCFLYATGLFMSLTRHEFGSWDYFRNLAFNFFGFYALLLAVRSIYLFRHPGVPRPALLDIVMASVLTAAAVSMLALALVRNTPMRVFAIIGVVFTVIEWRELKAGFAPRAVLYARHARYMLTTFLYVLTVASIVHLGEELSRNVRWLWPTVLGLLLVPLASSRAAALVPCRRGLVRFSAWTAVAVALFFGVYAMFELATGRAALGGRAM